MTSIAELEKLRRDWKAKRLPSIFSAAGHHQLKDGRSIPRYRLVGEGPVFLACPNCFDPYLGGGIIVDGVCTNGCPTTFGFSDGSVKKSLSDRSRPEASWSAPVDGGDSLLDRALAGKRDGLSAREIATQLSELTGRKIGVANVRSHLWYHAKAAAADAS